MTPFRAGEAISPDPPPTMGKPLTRVKNAFKMGSGSRKDVDRGRRPGIEIASADYSVLEEKMKNPPNSLPVSVVCAFAKCQRGPRKTRKKFTPSRPHQKFCSDSCRYRDWMEKEKQGGMKMTPRQLAARLVLVEKKLGL
jgi:hypothetical protein